jgi:hypothetical protein
MSRQLFLWYRRGFPLLIILILKKSYLQAEQKEGKARKDYSTRHSYLPCASPWL